MAMVQKEDVMKKMDQMLSSLDLSGNEYRD